MRILTTFVMVLMILSVMTQQQYEFVAQVGRLMDIIINSLYTQKDIFLRELISNASDALDKIRFLAITNPDILGSETELQIKIQYDEDNKILQILDNGIGMTKNDLISNLGTVAKSGTANFLNTLKQGNINLIGQFGVGFYSSFLVGSKVEVISKHNDDLQHKWVSSAANSFTVQENSQITLKRGTLVRLHLKQDSTQYCKYQQLQKLINRYSTFINYPIYLQKKVEVEQKIQKTEQEIQKQVQAKIDELRKEGKQPEEIDQQEIQNSINRTTTIKTWKKQFQRINQNKPLWLRDRQGIKKSEYQEFYKAIFKDSSNPLTWTHFKTEGEVSFTGLLYIPQRAPYDQFQKFFQKKSEVKLYVRRVLINDQFEDLLPKYLNFMKVIVDSDVLALNVNRENLQQDKMLKTIGNKLTKKAVQMLVDFNPDPEDDEDDFEEEEEEVEGGKTNYQKKVQIFNKFWKNYAKNIKFGMIQDHENRQKLSVLTRWYSTHNTSQLTSIDQYISRMKEGQKNIYYLGGDNKEVIAASPFIQRLVKEGYQVILGDDPLDQTLFNSFREYKTYKVVNVARNDFKQPYKTDELRKQIKFLTKTYQPLIDYAKKQLKDVIKDVKISIRLVDTPVVIVADMMNDTPNRQRLEAATAMKSNLYYQRQKNILQINPHDPMIQQLNKIVEEQPDQDTSKLVKNLYYAGLIHSGYLVKDPFFFSKSVFDLINTAFGVKEEVEEIAVSQEDIDAMEAEQVKQKQGESSNNKQPDEVITLDEQNVKVAGGNEEVIDLDEGQTQQQPHQQQQAPEEPSSEEL